MSHVRRVSIVRRTRSRTKANANAKAPAPVASSRSSDIEIIDAPDVQSDDSGYQTGDQDEVDTEHEADITMATDNEAGSDDEEMDVDDEEEEEDSEEGNGCESGGEKNKTDNEMESGEGETEISVPPLDPHPSVEIEIENVENISGTIAVPATGDIVMSPVADSQLAVISQPAQVDPEVIDLATPAPTSTSSVVLVDIHSD